MDRLSSSACEILSQVFEILQICGLDRTQIATAAAQVLQRETEPLRVESIAEPMSYHLACTDIVFHWRRAARFVDSSGLPDRLSYERFEALVAMAAPHHAASDLLRYMGQLRVVNCHSNGLVELATESVLACSGVQGRTIAPETVLAHMQGFLGSVVFNLGSKPDNTRGRFERACYAKVAVEYIPVLERLVEERGQNFVDGIDEWLGRHRVSEGADPAGVALVGAGAYIFVQR